MLDSSRLLEDRLLHCKAAYILRPERFLVFLWDWKREKTATGLLPCYLGRNLLQAFVAQYLSCKRNKGFLIFPSFVTTILIFSLVRSPVISFSLVSLFLSPFLYSFFLNSFLSYLIVFSFIFSFLSLHLILPYYSVFSFSSLYDFILSDIHPLSYF
jgi:hypothetical protein